MTERPGSTRLDLLVHDRSTRFEWTNSDAVMALYAPETSEVSTKGLFFAND